MDKLTVQIALILAVYGITLLTMFGLSQLVSLNPTAYKMLNSLIWGFNFIFGMMIALLSKKFFVFLRKTGLMTRQYPNNFMLNRIAGVVFDVMVVSSILAINFEDLSKNNIWIAFLLISSVGGAATMFYLHHLTKRVYKEYPLEGFSGMYGMLTGTASTGIALLREVDPYYKNTCSNRFGHRYNDRYFIRFTNFVDCKFCATRHHSSAHITRYFGHTLCGVCNILIQKTSKSEVSTVKCAFFFCLNKPKSLKTLTFS